MQLILLMLLLLSGKTDIGAVVPLIEQVAGGEGKALIDEVTGVAQAVKALSPAPAAEGAAPAEGAGAAFPLSPVAGLADADIAGALSAYISSEQ